jgi:hypothetical protein
MRSPAKRPKKDLENVETQDWVAALPEVEDEFACASLIAKRANGRVVRPIEKKAVGGAKSAPRKERPLESLPPNAERIHFNGKGKIEIEREVAVWSSEVPLQTAAFEDDALEEESELEAHEQEKPASDCQEEDEGRSEKDGEEDQEEKVGIECNVDHNNSEEGHVIPKELENLDQQGAASEGDADDGTLGLGESQVDHQTSGSLLDAGESHEKDNFEDGDEEESVVSGRSSAQQGQVDEDFGLAFEFPDLE